jgi:transcriptional regulator GlxA family with amidase domain
MVALGRLTGALPLVRRPALGGRDALHNLLTYIHSHLSEPLTLDSLSRALFLNRHTISKLFSERVGCGLNAYVNAMRVSMAENLLREGQAGVAEIVEKCGFGSERTFYRAFQAQRGEAPGRLRRHIGEMGV